MTRFFCVCRIMTFFRRNVGLKTYMKIHLIYLNLSVKTTTMFLVPLAIEIWVAGAHMFLS